MTENIGIQFLGEMSHFIFQGPAPCKQSIARVCSWLKFHEDISLLIFPPLPIRIEIVLELSCSLEVVAHRVSCRRVCGELVLRLATRQMLLCRIRLSVHGLGRFVFWTVESQTRPPWVTDLGGQQGCRGKSLWWWWWGYAESLPPRDE